jgi:creatinine amidohydrolase/Fe(II)-dependent formamide hydrolase-like protein
LHKDPSGVRVDKIADNMGKQSPYTWGDLFADGPITVPGYHSQGTETGVGGQPSLATAEKGRIAFEEAVSRLVEFATLFQSGQVAASRSKPRKSHHPAPPTIPTPG